MTITQERIAELRGLLARATPDYAEARATLRREQRHD